jgi:hypothetical protein
MRPGLAFVISCAFVGLSGAAKAEDAVPVAPDNGLPMVRYGDEAPRPGYHLVRAQMTGFFVASSFFFGIGYLASIGIASNAKFENGSAWLVVPVVGPFVGVTKAEHCGGFTPPRQPEDCASPLASQGLVALGIMQTVGAILFPFGFLHRRYWQRNTLVPTVSTQDGLRVGVVGTF